MDTKGDCGMNFLHFYIEAEACSHPLWSLSHLWASHLFYKHSGSCSCAPFFHPCVPAWCSILGNQTLTRFQHSIHLDKAGVRSSSKSSPWWLRKQRVASVCREPCPLTPALSPSSQCLLFLTSDSTLSGPQVCAKALLPSTSASKLRFLETGLVQCGIPQKTT